jgi:hypothetical protein
MANGGDRGRLKPERVQDGLALEPPDPGRESAPPATTGWTRVRNGRALGRTRDFSKPQDAAAYAGFITEVVSARRKTVGLSVSRGRVVVHLQENIEGGVTKEVRDLAAELG